MIFFCNKSAGKYQQTMKLHLGIIIVMLGLLLIVMLGLLYTQHRDQIAAFLMKVFD